MYLLMLLATFISAIYGYNLSARPDYDRDVPKKKAMAVVYKFLFQEKSALDLFSRVSMGTYNDDTYRLNWVLPNDRVYADFGSNQVDEKNQDTTLFYAQLTPTLAVKPFYMRKKDTVGDVSEAGYAGKSADYLQTGRHYYNGTEMISQLLCLDKEMEKSGAKSCEPTPSDAVDSEGNPIGYIDTCCKQGKDYLVSYKKLDSRWINRIHRGISLDFMRAIVDRDYHDNIGVIRWDGDKTCKGVENTQYTGCWTFQGKISFLPVYYDDMIKWENEHIDPETGVRGTYPRGLQQRGSWDLPKSVFPENFFTNKDGENICENGCLFRIRGF